LHQLNTHTNNGTVEPAWVSAVLDFWFGELKKAQWFARSEIVDAQIRERFLSLHERLAADDAEVPALPRPLLAAIIVLDQFSRNLFRGTARAFAADAAARRLSRIAIEQGFDRDMQEAQRVFLYMPFEHSESREDQALSVELIARLGSEEWTDYAIRHKAIIDRFGRFPHRNAILDRVSSPQEIAFLREKGSSF
jgi:uncharacterized protein (DUF924 family)